MLPTRRPSGWAAIGEDAENGNFREFGTARSPRNGTTGRHRTTPAVVMFYVIPFSP